MYSEPLQLGLKKGRKSGNPSGYGLARIFLFYLFSSLYKCKSPPMKSFDFYGNVSFLFLLSNSTSVNSIMQQLNGKDFIKSTLKKERKINKRKKKRLKKNKNNLPLDKVFRTGNSENGCHSIGIFSK